ncbi:MAG: type II toxin-antitoxin system VapC family toxin [Nitrospirae bacterium]|nr:type II toxin-antitoxin system VapC family toxin [Nitrospirota bacterium]
MEPRKIAIDASVAIKWYLTDESNSEIAEAMLMDYKEARIRFIVPRLFHYEMMNSIHIAVRTKRIAEGDAKEILADLFLIETTIVDSDELIKAAYLNARKYNISGYDALYLSVANKTSVMLYTADRKFYEAIKGKERFVKWVEDYGK